MKVFNGLTGMSRSELTVFLLLIFLTHITRMIIKSYSSFKL